DDNPFTRSPPCPRRCPTDDYWRSLPDEYNARRSPTLARVQRTAVLRRLPIRLPAKEPSNFEMRTGSEVIRARRKTPGCRHQRHCTTVPGTDDETVVRAPARIRKIHFGSKSIACHPQRGPLRSHTRGGV